MRTVYFFTPIGCDADCLGAVLGGPAGAWLPQPATPADGGWWCRLRDASLPTNGAGQALLVEVGPAYAFGPGTVTAINWRLTAGGARVFEGDLEVEPLGPGTAQLSLRGRYRLSRAVDAAEARRVHLLVEAQVRRFVLDVADRLAALAQPAWSHTA